jgi:hypothetical protein
MTNRSVRFAVSTALGLALAGLAGSGVAFAQDPPPADPNAPPPAGETTPPPATGDAAAGSTPAGTGAPTVTLRQGGISVDGDVVVGLDSGGAGEPIQIVPNFYYGVSDVLSVGLAHNPGAEIFQTSGRGLCLTGETGGCLKVYNNLSLDALFSFMRSAGMDLAAHAGLDFITLSDPTALSLRLGVKGKALAGPLIIVFDPSINIGLTERDGGNKEILQLPVRLGFLVTPQLNLGVSVALVGLLDGFGDTYVVPLGLGGTFAVNNQLALRAQFTFDGLISGFPGGGSADFRTLSVGAIFTM